MASITFGANQVSSFALDEFNKNTRGLQRTTERLSSGLKVNKPADDAALFSVGNSLAIQRALGQQGVRNLSDGISATNIADAALGTLSSIVSQQKELAEQAANGVLTSDQRSALNSQAQALATEFNRIVSETEFNGTNLLDSSVKGITIDTGNGTDGTVEAEILGFGEVSSVTTGLGTYTPQVLSPSNQGLTTRYFVYDMDGDGADDIVTAGGEGQGGGNYIMSVSIYFGDSSGTLSEDYNDTRAGVMGGNFLGLSVLGLGVADLDGAKGIDIRVDFSATDDLLGVANDSIGIFNTTTQAYGLFTDNGTVFADISTTGSTTGDFNGDGIIDQVSLLGPGTLQVDIQDTVTTVTDAIDLSQDVISLTTATGAQDALTTLQESQDTIDLVRGRVGASISRLEAATEVTRQNYEAATNNLLDIDVAEEVGEQASLRIKQQAAAAVLAQANQIPQVAFQLLQGAL